MAKQNPGVYLPDFAMTLNNLANLVQADSQRRDEAETLFQEALKNYRQLAKQNTGVYLPDLANTLGSMGLAYFQWGENNKALPLLKEATKILRPFAKNSSGVFAEKQVFFLILLAFVSEQAKEQCTTSREALGLTKNSRWIEILQGIEKKSCQLP